MVEALHSMKFCLYKLAFSTIAACTLLILSNYKDDFSYTAGAILMFLLAFRYAFIALLVAVSEWGLDEERHV